MKFLIDQPLSPILAAWLRSVEGGSHEAAHVRERGASQAPDAELFRLAACGRRLIVTADLDFPRLMALGGSSSEPATSPIRKC